MCVPPAASIRSDGAKLWRVRMLARADSAAGFGVSHGNDYCRIGCSSNIRRLDVVPHVAAGRGQDGQDIG